jgi:hypothetical protein
MKKILIFGLVALLAVAAFASMDASRLGAKVAVPPVTLTAGAATTNATIDKMDLGDGVAKFVFSTAIVTNAAAVEFEIQSASAATGTFAKATSVTLTAATNAVVTGSVGYDLTGGGRYIRVVSESDDSDVVVSGFVISFP